MILNLARSMLKSKNLPKEFWAKVVACTVYLSNLSPTRKMYWKRHHKKHIVEESQHVISHLRVFESIAHAYVPDERIIKLDEKSERFIFIGYDSNSKGYKLYNPDNKMFIISQDVIVDEEGGNLTLVQVTSTFFLNSKMRRHRLNNQKKSNNNPPLHQLHQHQLL